MEILLEVVDAGGGCFVLNRAGSTIALISSQGYIDWLLRRPELDGPLYAEIDKEAHLAYVQGLKLMLTPPTPATELVDFDYAYGLRRQSVTLTGRGLSKDGNWASTTDATLELSESGEYEWRCRSTIRCQAHDPVELSTIEYNNMYPGRCGRRFLYAPSKEYHSTLMVDRNDTVWSFPHQHLMPYHHKIGMLHFGSGTWAGFFGEQNGSPVCVLESATLAPTWDIGSMCFDLHCQLLSTHPIQPDEAIHAQYTIRYLTAGETADVLARAKSIPVTDEDRTRHEYPRLELGMNHFDSGVSIDRFDDASGFRQQPPGKIWDREVGHRERGSLRLHQEEDGELVWSAEPPAQIPPDTELRVKAMVRTQFCRGRGIFIRLRYHTFVWHPTPHVEWVETYESEPVAGSTGDWVEIAVPLLKVPENHRDFLISIDVVLEGPGTAWLTDCDVDLVHVNKRSPGAL